MAPQSSHRSIWGIWCRIGRLAAPLDVVIRLQLCMLIVYYIPFFVSHWIVAALNDVEALVSSGSEATRAVSGTEGGSPSSHPTGLSPLTSSPPYNASMHHQLFVGVWGQRRVAALLMPVVGAAAWLGVMHSSVKRTNVLLSGLSLTERAAATTRTAVKTLGLAAAVCILYAPQRPLQDNIYVVVFGTGLLFMPAKLRVYVAMYYVPHIATIFRAIRSGLALVHYGDLCYYDRQVSCEKFSLFIGMELFGVVAYCAIVNAPTLHVAVATFSVAFFAIVFGACRNDGIVIVAFLTYTTVIVALQHWSRTRAQADMCQDFRANREARIIADEIELWASPLLAAQGSQMEAGGGGGEHRLEAGGTRANIRGRDV